MQDLRQTIKFHIGKNFAMVSAQIKQSPLTVGSAILMCISATGLYLKLSMALSILPYTIGLLPLAVIAVGVVSRDFTLTLGFTACLVLGGLISVY